MATAAGTDSGVETGNESNDLDDISINVNVINEMGHQIPMPLEDCPESPLPCSSSSFESGLHGFLHHHQSTGSPGSDEKEAVPPPPPPTSPNICEPGYGGTSSSCQFSGDFQTDSLDNIHLMPGSIVNHTNLGDNLEDERVDEDNNCEIEDDGDCEDNDLIDEVTMDRDFNEDGDNDDDLVDDSNKPHTEYWIPPSSNKDDQQESGHGSYSPSPPFHNEFSAAVAANERLSMLNIQKIFI